MYILITGNESLVTVENYTKAFCDPVTLNNIQVNVTAYLFLFSVSKSMNIHTLYTFYLTLFSNWSNTVWKSFNSWKWISVQSNLYVGLGMTWCNLKVDHCPDSFAKWQTARHYCTLHFAKNDKFTQFFSFQRRSCIEYLSDCSLFQLILSITLFLIIIVI